MGISRRSVLAATGAGAVAGTGALPSPAQAAPPATGGPALAATPGAAAALTTMGQTVMPGADVGKGYRRVMAAAGEPHVVRTDITSSRTSVTYALGAFAHLSNLHIVDDQCPCEPIRLSWSTRASVPRVIGRLDGRAAGYRPIRHYVPPGAGLSPLSMVRPRRVCVMERDGTHQY